MQIFLKELLLEDGFDVIVKPKPARTVAGVYVSAPSGADLWISMRGLDITCWCCGARADRWVADKGRKHQGAFVLNLWGSKQDGRLVMMTRDHIIPKSKGGKDVIANLRPGCESCNSTRGSIMDEADTAFMLAHPELIDARRLAAANKRMEKNRD